MEQAYRNKAGLEQVVVEDTGGVTWLVDDAMRMEVTVPMIVQAIMQLIASRNEKGYSARYCNDATWLWWPPLWQGRRHRERHEVGSAATCPHCIATFAVAPRVSIREGEILMQDAGG